MQKLLAALAPLLLLLSTTALAQVKVASYAYGKPGTATYEQLSFWVKDGKRTDVYYTYGKDRKEVKLRYAGKKQPATPPGFNVQFTNNHLLTIAPSGTALRVSSATGAAPKRFAWEYEGPVNGVGTFCRECAADEKEAMQLLQAYLK